MIEVGKIYNEDCLIGMTKIPDGTVDFVCTDLPFGITSNEWDKPVDLAKFWEQINRVTKMGGGDSVICEWKISI